jgi:tellurite resistance protein
MLWFEFAVQYFGIPGAMLAVALWAYHRGWVISGRELTRLDEERRKREDFLVADAAHTDLMHRQRYSDLQARYDELKAEATQRLTDLRDEKDMWRDVTLQGLRIAEVAAEKATGAKT